VTLVLLGSIILLVGLPSVLVVLWKVTRPPLGARTFRWVYLAWAALLAAASVWNLTRDVRLSADDAGADNFVRLAFLALGGLIILFVGAKYRFVFVKELAAGALGIFFVFALWGTASTLWSVSPAATVYKSSEYCAMLGLFALAASLILLSFGDPRSQLLALKGVFDWHWFLFFLLIISVYVGVLVWPEYAILRSYRDEMGMLGFSIQGALPGLSANAVGDVAAIIGVVAFVRILEKSTSTLFYVPILLVSLLTMVLTQSRTPILAFLIAIIVVLLISGRFVLMAIFGALLGTSLLTGYFQLAYTFMQRGQDEQGLTSFTGRLGWWEASLQALQENWVNGYGANVGGRYALESVLGEEVATVHSSWVEVLLDTGVAGLVLFLAALITTWYWLFRLRPNAMENSISRLLWYESLGVLTVLCVRSVFAVNLAWSFEVLTLGTVLVFIGVARRQVVQAHDAGAARAQPLPATRRRRPSIRR
jgi:O-antigen ligase